MHCSAHPTHCAQPAAGKHPTLCNPYVPRSALALQRRRCAPSCMRRGVDKLGLACQLGVCLAVVCALRRACAAAAAVHVPAQKLSGGGQYCMHGGAQVLSKHRQRACMNLCVNVRACGMLQRMCGGALCTVGSFAMLPSALVQSNHMQIMPCLHSMALALCTCQLVVRFGRVSKGHAHACSVTWQVKAACPPQTLQK